MRERKNAEQPTGPAEGEIGWTKIGASSFNFRGKIIKPGQKFFARPDEIPAAFRDVIIPDVPMAEVESRKIDLKVAKMTYEVVKNEEDDSLWDVKDSRGKIWNEKPLTKEIAEKFAKDLEK